MNERRTSVVEGTSKTRPRTYSLYPRDEELARWGKEFLGCSQSEFVRSAIRMFATHLQAIEKRGAS